MNPENIKNSIQAVVEGLTPLAQKLQVPLEKLFGYAVKENYIMAVQNILFAVLVIVAWILFFKWKKTRKEEIEAIPRDNSYYSEKRDAYEVFNAFKVVTTVILTLVSCGAYYGLERSISRIANPEYNAIRDIVEMAKTSK